MAHDVLIQFGQRQKDPAAQALGSRGGIARKRNLSAAKLTEIGKKGANARWYGDKKKTVVPIFDNQYTVK